MKVHFAVHVNMKCCTKSCQGKTIGLKESSSNTETPMKIHIILQLKLSVHCFNSFNKKLHLMEELGHVVSEVEMNLKMKLKT